MGCIKKIISFIIFIAIVYAFFAFGGYDFVKNKYNEYTKPKREVFVQEEKDFGDLSEIPVDYTLSRSLNLLGYRKLNAIYIPKNQKITILDLNHNDILTEDDFQNGMLEEKLENFSGKIMYSSIVPISNIEAVKSGTIKTGSKEIPYADFEATVKILPIFKVKGTIAIYETKNRETFAGKVKDKIKNQENTTSKLVISCRLSGGYEDEVTKEFISKIKL